MSLSTQLLHTINRIADELSPEECKRVLYLCGELHTQHGTDINIKEMLQSCMGHVHTDRAFLMELMLRMKRYDLLSGVLGISKAEAELSLKNGHALSSYRVLMAELSEDFGSDDFDSLLFLLRGILPKEKLEKSECFLDVVVELEKLNQISSTRMDVMEKYLRAIHRVDLAKKLRQYQSRVETQRPFTVKQREERWPFRAASSLTSTVLPSSSMRNPTTPYSQPTVPECVTFTKPYEQWQEDVYRMRSEPRGMCVIIDCVGNEGAHLQELFLSLHFHVSLHMLLSISEVLACLQDISKQTDHYSYDAFVCFIISRSHSSRLLATDSYSQGLDLNTVRQFFLPDSCSALTGKPKLFFIQSYDISEPSTFSAFSDDEDGVLETDSPVCNRHRMEEVPGDADIFWSHCWTNEKQLQDIAHHSVYLQSLKEALVDGQKRRIHLVDLHMVVNRAVYAHNHSHPASAYHINLRYTLRKNLYLS